MKFGVADYGLNVWYGGDFDHEERLVRLKEIGYRYVTLDLAGFRSGSMNEVLSLREVTES